MHIDAITLFYPDAWSGYLSMFWHAIVFEFPRFMLATSCVALVYVFQRDSFAGNQPHLSVSVLLPGHNEGAHLEGAIRALGEQTYKGAQIVVVDDGSTDDMAKVAQDLQRRGLIDTFLSTGLRGGKSAAANLGLQYCTGDIIVITDIDTTFDRDAIDLMLKPFADPKVGAVSGNLAVRNARETVVSRFQAIQYALSISVGRRISDMLGTLFIASGAFAAFRRHAIVNIGGWEVGPGEDADITVKLRRAGWRIRFQPKAWALTDVPTTSVALFKQRLRWNRSLVRVRVRKFANVFNPWSKNFRLADALGHADIIFYQGIMPAAFYGYLIWLLAAYGGEALFILAAVSAVYIASSVLAFIVASLITDRYVHWRLLPYVPGYALYNAYLLRAVSVYAYLDELLSRKSYKDSYVPTRVLNAAEKF